MKKSFIIIFTIVCTLLYSSCGDEFLNRVDETTVNSETFYQTEADAIASVNGAYAPLQNISLWGRRIHFMLDFASDEIATTPNTQGSPFELILHTFGPEGNEHIENPWRMLYRLIAKANITLIEVSEMEIDQQVKDEVIGQAQFLRALGYFYINALWNGGPLRVEENFDELHTPRAAPEEIWTLIESDLQSAADKLPWQWDDNNVGRATRGAAKALLGKAHLYQEEYGDAERELMEVINEGPYYLMGGPNDPTGAATTVEGAIAAMRKNHDFGVKNIGETVFEVQFLSNAGGLSWNSGNSTGLAEATIRPREYGVDGSSFYNGKPSPKLLAAYEGNGGTGIGDRDPRFEAFFFTENDSIIQGGTVIPYASKIPNVGYAWKKYQLDTYVQNPNDPNDNDVNHDVIRYADVILMAAEAKIQTGAIAEGIALINQVRLRADPTGTILAPRPASASQEEAIDFLIQERQVELAGEQVRRTDLVRWGIANQEISGFQVNKHEYFPIPQIEINNNQALTIADQNPGYN